MPNELRTGVYQILNLTNGKSYIGSAAVRFSIRWKDHRHHLRQGRHHSNHLQHSWNTHGPDAFEFRIIERCEPGDCVSREQFWIEHFESSDRSKGYNMSPTAGSLLGMKRRPLSEETKAKISAANRGKKGHPISDEMREKLTAGIRRSKWKHSPEARLKMSLSRRGVKKSDEMRRKLSETNRGRKHSLETIAKMTGRKKSASQIEKMRAASLGKRHTEESKQKMSIASAGRKVSAERKLRQAEYKRNWWASRKKETVNYV